MLEVLVKLSSVSGKSQESGEKGEFDSLLRCDLTGVQCDPVDWAGETGEV